MDQELRIEKFLDEGTEALNEVVAATKGAISLLHEYWTALISAAVTSKLDISAEPAT